jgi:hypothetical protein
MSVHALLATFKTEGSIENRRLRPPLDDLDRNELAVLRWLLWRLQDDGCHPSDADVKAGTGLALRSIERARNGLRDRGLITWREGRARGKRGSNEYDLTATLAVCLSEQTAKLAELPAKSDPTNRQTGGDQTAKLAEDKKNREVEEEKKDEAAAAAAASSSLDDDLEQLVLRVYSMWNEEVWPDRTTPLTDERRGVIADRLAAYDPEDLEAAIRNREQSDWFSGRKPRDGKQRFDLTDLLASDETLEELRDAGEDDSTRDFIARLNSSRPAYDHIDESWLSPHGGLRDPSIVRITEKGAEDEPGRDLSRYDALVEPATSDPPPARIRAEHAELSQTLKALEDQLAQKDSDHTRRGIDLARDELRQIEDTHPGLFEEAA